MAAADDSLYNGVFSVSLAVQHKRTDYQKRDGKRQVDDRFGCTANGSGRAALPGADAVDLTKKDCRNFMRQSFCL